MSSNLASKILKNIEEENVTPKSRNKLLVERLILWIPGAVGSLLGGAGFGVLFFQMLHGEIRFGLAAVSFSVWILLVLVSVLFAKASIRKTKKGYTFEPKKVFMLLLMTTVIIGTISYKTQMASYIDNSLDRFSGSYDGAYTQLYNRWTSPLDGRLAGKILSVGADSFALIDRNGIIWEMEYSDRFLEKWNPQDLILVKKGEIKVRGKIIDKREKVFLACDMSQILQDSQRISKKGFGKFQKTLRGCETK